MCLVNFLTHGCLCSVANTTSLNLSTAELVIVGNLSLYSQVMVAHMYLKNKLPLFPFEWEAHLKYNLSGWERWWFDH